jgi:hypothetical protein
VIGGSDADTVTVNTATGSGTFNLNDGDDTMTFSAGVTATFGSVEHITSTGSAVDLVSLKANYDGAEIDLNGGTDTLTFLGAGTATIANVENVMGSTRDNEITINGSVGVTADMGGGSDIVHLGAGTDNITGGSGFDEFIFTSAANANGDTIVDFTTGVDVIEMEGVTLANNTLNYLGDDATLTATGNGQAFFDTTNNALKIDTDGNGTADITITLTGVGAGGFDESDLSWSL